MDTLVIALVGLAILGLVLAAVVGMSRRETGVATGRLAEAARRDRGPVVLTEADDTTAVAATGKEIEALAKASRAGTLVAAPADAPVAYVPPDPETLGVTRRQFLNRSIVVTFGLGLSGFGAACIAFLWPGATGGFGGKINVGRISDIESAIAAGDGFFYVPEGRMWVTAYPHSAIEKAQSSYTFYSQVEQGLSAGVVALFQTCPHLGCRVPECATSQWFECPCHGSQYNRVGEKKGGPAPRGMDRFPMEVTAGNELIVDTGTVIQGPPIGTNTTGQEAEGPNCISSGGGH